MADKERLEVRVMQNPGDMRIPEGKVLLPAKRVLVLGESASKVRLEDYDDIQPLYENGHRPTQRDEEEEIRITTRR
jgi:hypothetical protein